MVFAKWRVKAKLKHSAHLAAECVSHSAFLFNLVSVKTHWLRYC
ncbi:Uncharacterised protein [Weeksella virosa]|uniref:Uncharacterized protein n=1 Tax=Weeksella virosa (strain ATCC 43766 / DSM 16922 / JCM 21250 / CCUG 30538 / CDC 9751 / IAM 14551 / NBRC 16016 / NCTC 11634 / CL345/78) TaxID=865938 RepID=F0NY55_WEEVC|nr:hypothetical protein Weevi_0326 [Weeksella virosa DSM 16922]SUP53312.1 Uncharacterised protein [Weeksella virosa]VEH63222.1 Uncharacterised protein [Weeksella virosa]